MMLSVLLWVSGGMAITMTAAWMFQRIVRNAGWIDVFWTFGTGAACVAAAMWPGEARDETRQVLVAALGAIWSLRLGLYVAMRVAGSVKEDARYANLRREWGARFQPNMFVVAIIQAPATALLVLSVFVAAHGGAAEIGVRDVIGAAVLLVAIAGEALADDQMRRFKKSAAHGAIMDKGLWGWSRHPNYFFEWFGWLAYPVIALDPADPLTWTTLVAPALMFVILRYGTGVPVLERIMLASRGDRFRDYQARVSAFFLLPPRKPST